MVKTTELKRSKLYAAFVGVAALALFTACADDPAQEEAPVDPGVEQDPMQDDPMQDDPMQDDPAEDPMTDDMGDEGNEIEGAGSSNATSTLGFVGSTVSWTL